MKRRHLKKFVALMMTIVMLLPSVPVFASQPADQELLNTQPVSAARQKYYDLLDGNHFSNELKERFFEMFGEMPPDYVR